MKIDKKTVEAVRKSLARSVKKNPLQMVQLMGLQQVSNEIRAKYGNDDKLILFISKAAPCWALARYDHDFIVRNGIRDNLKKILSSYHEIINSDNPKGLKKFLIQNFEMWHYDEKSKWYSVNANKKMKQSLINLWKDAHSTKGSGSNAGSKDDDVDSLIKKMKATTDNNDNDDDGMSMSMKKRRHNHDIGPEL